MQFRSRRVDGIGGPEDHVDAVYGNEQCHVGAVKYSREEGWKEPAWKGMPQDTVGNHQATGILLTGPLDESDVCMFDPRRRGFLYKSAE